MYDFHYNYIMKKFPTARLLFTDTDSLCYHIETEKDLYDEIKVRLRFLLPKLKLSFRIHNIWISLIIHLITITTIKINILFLDTSRMKMVSFFHLIIIFYISFNLGGDPIKEFCGLRAKMYSVKSPNREKKAAKGVSGKNLVRIHHIIL